MQDNAFEHSTTQENAKFCYAIFYLDFPIDSVYGEVLVFVDSAGLPVFARWSDRYYYPANVVRPVTSTEACVVVAFDEDGSEYRASLMDVFVCDLLPGDMEVMAQREGVDYSEVAKVIRHFQEGDTVGYVVEFENGSQSR